MPSRSGWVLCDPLEIGSAEAWAYARQIHPLASEIGVRAAARELNVAARNAIGVYRGMQRWRGRASDERIAACCYVDPGVTPEDVAGWFGQTVSWAEQVYTELDWLRTEWPLSERCEMEGCGISPEDPSPEEISRMCDEFLRTSDIPLAKRVLTLDEFVGRWNAANLSAIVG